MAHNRPEDTLDECIEDIRAGRVTVEECIARYPSLREELESLLLIATNIVPLTVDPDPIRKRMARVQFVEALHAASVTPARSWWPFRMLARPTLAPMSGVLAVAIACALVSGGSAVYASEQAQPGDTLYGMKLAVEQMRLATAVTDEQRVERHVEIAARRLAEIERALERHNDVAAEAAAEGYVRAVGEAEGRLQRAAQRVEDPVPDRVEATLERQEQALARAAAEAPPRARLALERAWQQAAKGAGRAAATPPRRKDDKTPTIEPSAALRLSGTTPQPSPTGRPTPIATEAPLQPRPVEQERRADRPPPGGVVAPGRERSLREKLEAAQSSLERRQITAAANQLRAFRNELRAILRSGELSEATYRELLAAYEALLSAATREADDERRERRDRDDRPGRGRSDDTSPEALATPEPRSSEGRPDRDGPSSPRTERTPEPTATTPPRTPTPQPDSGRGRGERERESPQRDLRFPPTPTSVLRNRAANGEDRPGRGPRVRIPERDNGGDDSPSSARTVPTLVLPPR